MSHHQRINHKYQPRENQKIAIDNTIEGFASKGFHALFLEMSLGKTKCALNAAEVMHSFKALSRLVIICPKAIQSVWLEEIPKHSNFESAPLIWENKSTQKYKRALKETMTSAFPILIIRLEMFQKKNDNLKEFLKELYQAPTMVILDESSKIKNVDTERTPRVIEYTKDSAYRVILTGTPWTESPLDIFSQMEFLHPGFWYQYHGPWSKSTLKKHWYIFRNRYAVMQKITTGEGRTFQHIVGTRRTEEIARKIQPYITQQKKEDWLDLPDKVFQTLHVEMSKEQQEAYTSLKQKLLLEFGDQILTVQNAVTLLTRLRQVAGGFFPETGEQIGKHVPGIDILLEDVSEYRGKVVIAASYVAEIKGIVKALSKEYGEDQVCTYYGGTQDRDHELERFKSSARFLVLNPQSGAYGLNLQFASLMYLYSRPFSYEQNAQLVDRIHRPGQKNMCVYKDIVAAGTVQERVIDAITKKKNVVTAFDKLTAEEIIR